MLYCKKKTRLLVRVIKHVFLLYLINAVRIKNLNNKRLKHGMELKMCKIRVGNKFTLTRRLAACTQSLRACLCEFGQIL